VNPEVSINRPISEVIRSVLLDVPDFPQEGVVFKDLSPLWANPRARSMALDEMEAWVRKQSHFPTAIVGIESRGFLLGVALAERLALPFIAFRKKGKLPGDVCSVNYALEYGEATLECQANAINLGDRVLIHDDVLATGGTARAARRLVEKGQGEVWGYTFVLDLAVLNGANQLTSQEGVRLLSLATT
jgi:adenine phosphoribosyltransferase